MSKKGLAKNIFSVGLIQILNYAFPMITLPVVSRIFGPDKFGVLDYATTFVGYFTLLIGFGFDLTATRRVAVAPDNVENRNKVFSEVFLSQCLLLLISAVMFTVCLFIFPQLKEEKLVAIFTFLTCFATLMTQNWLFQAMQDLPKVALLNFTSKLLFTIIILFTIHQKEDYIWQPLVTSLVNIIIAAASFAWAVKKYQLKLYSVRLITCLTLLWSEKIFFFSLCVINLYSYTNTIVLGIFQNSTQVGYYSSGLKLITLLKALVAIPLAQAIFPYIGKAFGESHEKGINIAQQLIPIVILLTGALSIAIFAGSPLFIHVIYGDQFTPAVAVCRILSFIPMLVGLNTVLGIHVMMNLKMDKLFFRTTCVGAAIGLTLNTFLVNTIGYTGPAYTWLTIELINLFSFYFILKQKGINTLNLEYFKPSYFLQWMHTFQRRFSKKSELA
jgi:PST family polysaccharide transporter